MTAKNDHTGDALVTKAATDAYRDGWDRIWTEKSKEAAERIKASVNEAAEIAAASYLMDCFATPETASPERIRLALKAVEGLSTELLRDTMLPMYLVTGAAAIQTCKRLGIEIDNVVRLGEKK